MMKSTTVRKTAPLPKHVLDLLWEYPKDSVSWQKDSDLIIRKVLESGGWISIKWLLATTGFAWLKSWLIQRQGAGLEPKRLRFWQLALNLSKDTVDKWILENQSNPWHARGQR